MGHDYNGTTSMGTVIVSWMLISKRYLTTKTDKQVQNVCHEGHYYYE